MLATPSKNILGKRVTISGVVDAEKEELRKRVKELEETVKRLELKLRLKKIEYDHSVKACNELADFVNVS